MRRGIWLGGFLASLFAALLLAGLGLSQGGSDAKRLPVPNKAAQAKAMALVDDIFKEDFAAAKEPEARNKLAADLLQQARENKEDTANRYVLYREARNWAAKAGNFTIALQAIDELARDFEVNALEMKATALAELVDNLPGKEAGKALVDLLEPIINEAVEADQYDAALAFGKVAEAAARKAKILTLVASVQKRNEDVQTVKKSFAKMQTFVDRLKGDPADAEANSELGKYYAFLKGRWERALPLLEKGSDQALKTLAGQDLAKPKEPKDQLVLADAWWDLAGKENEPAKLHLQRRAMHWYEQAAGNLSGLNRTKALKRIDVVAARLSGSIPDGPIGPVGELKKFDGHQDTIRGVALSADGRWGVSGSVDQSVRVWDLTSGKEERTLRGHTKEVWAVAFHPNSRQVFSASWDATARLWDVKTGEEKKRYTHPIDVNGLVLSRDASTMLTCCDNQTVYLWDVVKGEELKRFSGHTNFVYCVAFSPDGRHIASGSTDRTVRVYDMSTGNTVKTFECANNVINVVFSSDGKHVLSSGDNVIHMWDIVTGKEHRRFEGHSGPVPAMALSPDGRRLLTGGDDKTIRLWDVNSGKELHKFTGHNDTVQCVAFSSDGRRAISGSFDRTVRLWGLPVR
ncbi:MAG: WD40 repeat domain-containing protein [Planctomycetes bacterium]|nr:WD40 repeat domain-containing protein [Planctomycetota bacterium]